MFSLLCVYKGQLCLRVAYWIFLPTPRKNKRFSWGLCEGAGFAHVSQIKNPLPWKPTLVRNQKPRPPQRENKVPLLPPSPGWRHCAAIQALRCALSHTGRLACVTDDTAHKRRMSKLRVGPANLPISASLQLTEDLLKVKVSAESER